MLAWAIEQDPVWIGLGLWHEHFWKVQTVLLHCYMVLTDCPLAVLPTIFVTLLLQYKYVLYVTF